MAKYDFPVLAEDPFFNLDAPTDAAYLDHLDYHFTDPEYTPVIAGVPAISPVPIGMTPPTTGIGWVLNPDVEIPEAAFPCKAGRTWINAMTHVYYSS